VKGYPEGIYRWTCNLFRLPGVRISGEKRLPIKTFGLCQVGSALSADGTRPDARTVRVCEVRAKRKR
jgi:hypothetical protein